MSQVYVRCCKTVGQANLTMGKEYEFHSRNLLRGTISVVNNADMLFAYDSTMFGGTYTHAHAGLVPKKHAEVIHAWADGAAIECFNKCASNAWVLAPFPTFSDNIDYRVKIKVDDKAIAACKADLDELAGEAAHFKRGVKTATDHYNHILDVINIKQRTLSSLESGDNPDD